MNPSRIRIVLLQTHHGKNLGAVARALANFGLPNLVLAELGAVNWADVNQTAVRAKHITEGARRVPSLAAAVEGCAWVVGTTMRRRPGQRDLHPRQTAERLAELSRAHDVAIVFGAERTGLSNRDLLSCHDVSIIPTSPELPSLNLSQAVLLYAWELYNARQFDAPPSPPRATEEEYGQLEDALRGHLDRRGFADPDRPRHGVADLLQDAEAGRTEPLGSPIVGGRSSRIEAPRPRVDWLFGAELAIGTAWSHCPLTGRRSSL